MVRRLVVYGVFLTALTAGASIARAQTSLTWDANGAAAGTGGTNTWDNKSAVWFDGTSFVSWTNSTFNNAIFAGTAGTVTVKGSLKVHEVAFNTAGYTITEGKLTMGGSVPTIRGSGTISSTIGGTDGLRFTGGTLTFLGAATYSGGTIVEDGTLVIDGRHQNNRVPINSLVTVNSGGTFRILGVNALPTHADSVDVAVNAGGTLNVVSGNSPLLSGEGSHAHLRNLTLNSGSVVLDYSGAGGAYSAESFLLHGDVTATGTSSITFGALANNARAGIALDGARTFTVTNAFDTLTVAAELENGDAATPIGTLIKAGAGILALSGSNTYTGGTQVNGGTVALGSVGALASSGTISFGGGTLQYSAANTIDYSGRFSSAVNQQYRIDTNGQSVTFASALTSTGGTLDKLGAGTLTLTGANSYSGGTNVIAGRLVINGDQSGATGVVSVASGATLNGRGTIGGTVVVADGATFAPGNPLAPGTLTINGDLALGSGSIVSYQLGQPVAGGALNDLTVVRGNLTLDGTLNVTTTAGGSFEPGIYRLFDYGGVLTNNGLTVGSVPSTDYFLQTAVPNQINLINTRGLALNFWDGGDPTKRNNGVVDGGNGTWQSSAGPGNWTTLTGNLNAAWNDGAFAIFEGTAGTVTVDNSLGQVVAEGLDFATSGYTIDGGPITLTETTAGTGRTTIRVGDGSGAGAGESVTIASVLQGTVQVVKTDLGTLILSGANTYSGGTAIDGGTLQVSSDANLGAAAGALIFNGGTLATTATFSTARATTLDADGGTFDVANATTLTMSGAIGGAGALTKMNTGALVLTGTNTYSGGTTISAGTLQVGGGGTSGSLAGNVTNNATLAFNRSDTMTYGGIISGTGAVNQIGTGTTVLTGTNTYSGGTTIAAGTLQLGNGTTNGSIAGNVTNNGVLAFNPAAGTTMTAAGVISGTGAVNHTGTGATVLTGTNTYSGATNVNAGTLYISGNQSAATGTVSVASGATLGGLGTIGGSVNVASGGTFSPGNGSPGTLTINGNLTLSSGSALNYQLGQPGVTSGAHNDLTVVKGNLTLDGTLNVSTPAGGSFEPGIYRLFNYGGTLTNNGLVVGTVPTPDFFLQTAVPNQINLINTAGLNVNFWDGGVLANRNNGVIDGGNGVWQSSASALGNWTTLNGTPNSPWNDGAFAIFEGTAGTVTVDNSLGQVVAEGLDFATSGYTIDGGPITLIETTAGTGRTTIRVGDDTAAGVSETVTIASVLQGMVQVVKTDLGTLILSGANTYSGGTAIDGGTLQVSSDANLGAAAGALTFDGGTLATTASFSSGRATTLNAEGGTFDVASATTLTMNGAIGGAGALTKINTGALVLTGTNTYSGGTTIAAGTLQIGGGGTSGSLAGNVTNNGTLAFNRSDTVTYGGVVSGTGAVNQIGTGTTVLTGTNTYTGGTTISAGTLQLGNGTTNGSIVGNVTNNGVLAFNPAAGTTMTFDGVISGTGAVNQAGTGTTVLTGTHTYSGGTAINGGTLQLEHDGNLGAAAGTLSFDGGTLATTSSFSTARSTTLNAGGGTFDVAGATTLTLSGAIGGTGTLSVTNTGTLVLSGINTYTGATNVTSGTLLVQGNQSAATGSVAVASGATLGGSGTIGGAVTIADGGTLAPGNSAGTLTVGALTLQSGSILNYELATPGIVGGGVNDLIVVGGGLTLAGTLNVSALDGFGAGSYRLFNYGGTFIDNGLEFGVLPSDFAYHLDTATGGQVNLTVANPFSSAIQYWDGTHTVGDGVVNGGSGVWSTATNWTDVNGNFNQAWGGQTAVFAGTSGTVTVVGSVTFNGLQFLTDGYSLVAGAGAELTTSTPGTVVLLGPGVQATDAVPIMGTGGITIQGGGSFVTTANNGYTGGTTIAAASTLRLGNGGNSGSIVGDVSDEGTLVFNRADTVSFSGTISGIGHVRQDGAGTLVLAGTNSFSGGTTFNAGIVSVSEDANLGAASGSLTFNGGTLHTTADVSSARSTTIAGASGTIDTDEQTTLSLSGAINGSGALVKNGAGTLVLTGTNSYSGGTTLNAGIVSVSKDANLGGASGSLTFNGGTLHTTADVSSARSTTIAGASGTIDTDEQTTFSLSGAIDGLGALVKTGTGRLLLSGSNTYGGGTLVSAGTLQGNTNSLQGIIVDNAALVVDQDNDGTFRGTLFGTGTLTKRGAGLVRLTGDHGLQGVTSVAAGTLELDGSLPGSVEVASGATFSATGVIGGRLTSSGTVVIGASGAGTSLDRTDGLPAVATPTAGGPGRLDVIGDITLLPGSQLHVGIDAAAGSASLVTNGRAFIDGTVVVDAQKDGFSRVTHYAIIGARNGLTGLSTATSTSTSLEPYLSRDASTLFVTLLRTDIPLQPYAVTGNGWSAGGAFDRTRANATGDLLYVTRQLTALDDAQLGSALDAVSGEIHASQTQLAAIDGESVTDVTRSEISSRITSRARVEERARDSRASLWGSDRLRPWIRVRSDRGSFDAGSATAGEGDRPAAHGADTMLNGVVGGFDWSFANDWLAGIGGSYVDGKMTLDGLNEQSEFAAPRVLGYLGYAHDRWAIHTGLSVAHTMYDVTRRFQFAAIAPTGQLLFGTVDRTARSTPAGTASDFWVDGRYNAPIGSWDLQPRIGLRSASYRLGDWNETGADSLSLGGAAQTNSSLQGDIGLRTARAVGKLRPFLEGVYRRELSSGALKTTVALTDQPGGLFEVEGLGLTVDKFVGQTGALFMTNHVGLSLFYELHYSRAQTRHGLQFGVGF